MASHPPRRIAILQHASHPPGTQHHLVDYLAQFWRKAGLDVITLQGTDVFTEADILFLHVDRTIVPESYLDFARRYPVCINAGAVDIRKRLYADGLLKPGDSYYGPVVVKSDFNYAGMPEQSDLYHNRPFLKRARAKLQRMLAPQRTPLIRSKADYLIFDTLSDVPPEHFRDDEIIQKFVPECDDGKFLLREYYFLGDRHFESIEASDHALFTEDQMISIRPFTPPEDLLACRRLLKLDYGKIDYVLKDGRPFIFDANKTMGLGNAVDIVSGADTRYDLHPSYVAMVQGLAEGLLEHGWQKNA